MAVKTYTIDDRTRVRVGYPDGHIEVDVDLPFPLNVVQGTATRALSREAVISAVPAIKHALEVADPVKKVKARVVK